MTTIEWTRGDDGAEGKTWNPVRGCSRVSPGCDNCYAMRQAHRFSGKGGPFNNPLVDGFAEPGPYAGLTTIRKGKVDWTGTARFVPDALDAPLRWKKPKRIFVNSMSDLFHHDVTNEQIAAVFGVMAACPQHTFQILTKRPERMSAWFKWLGALRGPAGDLPADPLIGCQIHATRFVPALVDPRRWPTSIAWPLPNVWLGVSCENQETADLRIPLLLQVPAAVRFVSAEPLLGPIDFDQPHCRHCHSEELGHCDDGTPWCTNCDSEMSYGHWLDPCADADQPGVNWVIVGGESGHSARPCHVEWIRSIVRQCREADVACFVKQLGARYEDPINGVGGAQCKPDPTVVSITRLKNRKGGDLFEWPEDLRVREMPGVRDG